MFFKQKEYGNIRAVLNLLEKNPHAFACQNITEEVKICSHHIVPANELLTLKN